MHLRAPRTHRFRSALALGGAAAAAAIGIGCSLISVNGKPMGGSSSSSSPSSSQAAASNNPASPPQPSDQRPTVHSSPDAPDEQRRPTVTFSKEGFATIMQPLLNEVQTACGITRLAFDSNFEKIDESQWPMQTAPAENRLYRISGACAAMTEAVGKLCSTNARAEQWRPVVAREVRGIRCSFTGHHPKQKGEDNDVWLERNMTFSNGTMTVLMAPDMDLQYSESRIWQQWLADKAGAPAVKRLARGTGGSCSASKECGTGLCLKQVCTSCSSKVRCGGGLSCFEGNCMTSEQVTRMQENEEANEASFREGHKTTTSTPAPKGSARGRMCGKPSDCQSGSCKMENKSRGRCE